MRMQMRAPNLADSLRRAGSVRYLLEAVDDPENGSGWQQSKSIWALSAEVGEALRMCEIILWQSQAA